MDERDLNYEEEQDEEQPVYVDLEEEKKHQEIFANDVFEECNDSLLCVNEGDSVTIAYKTSFVENEEVVDQKDEKDPLEITIGSGMLLKAFEEELMGMMQGETKEFDLMNPYGDRNEKLIESVHKDTLPNQFHEIGHVVQFKDPNGKFHFARVKEINKEYITLDFNNPLAGKNLHFYVKVLKIQKED